MSHVDPEQAVFDAFKALDRNQPVEVLNLLRSWLRADYGDGRDASGAEAYAAYVEAALPVFRRAGGTILFRVIQAGTAG